MDAVNADFAAVEGVIVAEVGVELPVENSPAVGHRLVVPGRPGCGCGGSRRIGRTRGSRPQLELG